MCQWFAASADVGRHQEAVRPRARMGVVVWVHWGRGGVRVVEVGGSSEGGRRRGWKGEARG